MAAGVTKRLWEMTDLVEMLKAWEESGTPLPARWINCAIRRALRAKSKHHGTANGLTSYVSAICVVADCICLVAKVVVQILDPT